MSATFLQHQPDRLQRPGIIAGIAVSLLLHAVLIFGYRHAGPTAPSTQPASRLTVWLQPPKPIAKVELPLPPPEPLPPRKREKIPPLAKHDTAPPPAASSVAPVAPPVVAQAITLPTPAGPVADPLHPEQQSQKFDMAAALKTARKVASDEDPARAGLPVAQLDKHPLYPEQHDTQLARDIAGAKRGDCRNTPGGLLAPVFWILDKKDSGCKW